MGKFSFDEGQHIVISFYSEEFSYYYFGYNPQVKLSARSWLYKGLTQLSIMKNDKNSGQSDLPLHHDIVLIFLFSFQYGTRTVCAHKLKQ